MHYLYFDQVIKPAFIKTYDSLVLLKKKKENLFKKIIKFLLIKKKPEKELSWKRGRWHTNSFVGGGRGWEPRRAGGLEDWKRQGNILP